MIRKYDQKLWSEIMIRSYDQKLWSEIIYKKSWMQPLNWIQVSQKCEGQGKWGLVKGVKTGLRFALRAFIFKIQVFETFSWKKSFKKSIKIVFKPFQALHNAVLPSIWCHYIQIRPKAATFGILIYPSIINGFFGPN